MDDLLNKQSSDGFTFRYHNSSFVDDGSSVGSETRIWHFSHIMSGAKIGKNTQLGQNVFVGSKAKIGDNVKIQNNVSIYDDVIIENEVFVGPSVVFTNVINPRAFIERKNEFKKTIIKKGVSIGANATIVCGVAIGKYALIGAGSVVTKDVADYSLVYGNPATHKGFVCFCGNKINDALICNNCGKKYHFKNKIEMEELSGDIND